MVTRTIGPGGLVRLTHFGWCGMPTAAAASRSTAYTGAIRSSMARDRAAAACSCRGWLVWAAMAASSGRRASGTCPPSVTAASLTAIIRLVLVPELYRVGVRAELYRVGVRAGCAHIARKERP
jgi:hypothetical protein